MESKQIIKAKSMGAKHAEEKNIEVKHTEGNQTKENQTEESQKEGNQTEENETKENQTEENQKEENQTEENQTKESQTEKSQTEENHTKESQTEESQAKENHTEEDYTEAKQEEEKQRNAQQPEKAAETENDIGERLREKYIFYEELGNGGSGKVFKAYDRHLQSFVAVKRFPSGNGISERELEMLKELQHPAFPAVTDYMEEQGYRYLVMEYIEGRNLEDYIKEKGAVEQEQAVKWALELAEVLLYLHERECPVIYRDMKPANVMIDKRGKVRLVDFGTAFRRYQDGQEEYAGGTWGYAAPEQFDGKSSRMVDERSDIYGLGTTLFHMLTGCNPSRPPFLMQPLRFYDRRLSVQLERIVSRATAQEKEKRYSNVRRLKQALENYGRGDRVREYAGKTVKLAYGVGLGGFMFLFLRLWVWMEQHGHFPEEENRWKWSGRIWRELWEHWKNGTGIDCGIAVEMVLLAAAGVLLLCTGRSMAERWMTRGWRGVRLEKNVLLTEKKGKGLMSILLLWLLAAGLAGSVNVSAKDKTAETAAENNLFVVVRNAKGQKLLVRYDAEYPLSEPLNLELPLKNFEEGERYELRLECINRGTGETMSRTFYLKGVEP